MEKQRTVQDALIQFMRHHMFDTSIKDIDGIVLNYIVGVLEDIGTQDDFDVDDFVEMMDAYMPGFGELSNDTVCEWMFQLADFPSEGKENTPPGTREVADDSSTLCPGMFASATGQVRDALDERLIEDNVEDDKGTNQACGGKIQDEECEDVHIRLLLEMFPSSCVVEAEKCLTIADGDMEHATQLMMDRQIDGTSAATRTEIKTRQPLHKDDETLKASILDKYGYVDTDEDSKEHRPTAPKGEKKTMVRYLNNKTVTTRGERYVDIKKPESEEMKKTYINLKPGRKYRFH